MGAVAIITALLGLGLVTKRMREDRAAPAGYVREFPGTDLVVEELFARFRPYVVLLYCGDCPDCPAVRSEFRAASIDYGGSILFFEACIFDAAELGLIPETEDEIEAMCGPDAGFLIAGRLGPGDRPTTLYITDKYQVEEASQARMTLDRIMSWAQGFGNEPEQVAWDDEDLSAWVERISAMHKEEG